MIQCPRCRSELVAKIVYGIASVDPARDDVVPGGLVLRPSDPGWCCRRCGRKFGSAYERVRPLRR